MHKVDVNVATGTVLADVHAVEENTNRDEREVKFVNADTLSIR